MKPTHYITWGATMTLADFFFIVPIENTKKSIAIKTYKKEFFYDAVQMHGERCLPIEEIDPREVFLYRENQGVEEIFFNNKWRALRKWDGTAVHISTMD